MAETVADFIWEVDAHGLFTYASPNVENILGYTPAELVGKKPFYDLFIPTIREERKAAAFQVFAGRKAFRNFPNPTVRGDRVQMQLRTFSDALLAEAKNKNWTVISIKDNWKQIFTFEKN